MNKIENRNTGPTPDANAARTPVRLPSSPPDKKAPSDVSRWIEKAKQLPEVREDLVARVKAEIEAGTYETPEKLELAARRLLEELMGQ